MSTGLRIGLPLALTLFGLCACGGGGDGDGNSGGSVGGGNWSSGVFSPASTFANKCVSPRSGSSPVTGRAYPDTRGTLLDEQNFLRSWNNDLYLWYSEVTDRNPATYSTVLGYFDVLKTTQTTPSGQPKDKFHFTYSTADWEALSQSGVEVGYGLRWEIVSTSQSTRVFVAYVEPDTSLPASQAGLERGAEVEAADGVELDNLTTQQQVDTVNGALFPSDPNESHTFKIVFRNGSASLITLHSAAVTSAPVQNVQVLTDLVGKTGYIQFNDHIATAEGALMDAINTLKQQNIDDLVLDIRYNGGGYLAIASELSYMIAGAGPTAGRNFERLQFNDKHTTTNPVTGEALEPTPFYTETVGLPGGRPEGQTLPTLNLSRVYVLTGENTCSASESIINGLRGVDVEVIQIGSTTCGKPYGFYPQDNCGTTYFSIQFRGINAKEFGEYSDGFSPANTAGTAGEKIAGCSVADDFTRDLGDRQEARLEAALDYRVTGSAGCPAPSGHSVTDRMQAQAAGRLSRLTLNGASPWRNNRIVVPLHR